MLYIHGKKLVFINVIFIALSAYAQHPDSLIAPYKYSLSDLAGVTIHTGSIKAEQLKYTPTNITVVTKEMIQERGYQTLVDVCQDIPGFDFLMYNDGGGEYPTFNLHRGLGDIGNSEILIMIDGIIQNQISYNWSLIWTYESMFIDVERIEIVQGPGSVMYGAQAFSGVINIILKKDINRLIASSFFGSGNTKGGDLYYSGEITEDVSASFSFHRLQSTGDMGSGRYDPGGYFSNNRFPAIILSDYNASGDPVDSVLNPVGGTLIPSGFNTINDSYAFRTRITYKKTDLCFFISDSKRGYASEIVPYEYNVTDPDVTSHYRSFHINLDNRNAINQKMNLHTSLVFRGTHILPDGGFEYLYQYPGLKKKYASFSYQGYFEEKLSIRLSDKDLLFLGIKGMLSSKMERIISLEGELLSKYTTSSSWDIASAGEGLYQEKVYPRYHVPELASYMLWDKTWSERISSSLGIRYDYSKEFNHILNPRIAFDYNPTETFGLKYMFGTAFRQPTIFELTSEFRGNPDLRSQRIATSEVEVSKHLFNRLLYTKLNAFYSGIRDFIGKVEDVSMPAGERYENIDNFKIGGISAQLSGKISDHLKLYSNYCFLSRIDNDYSLYPIDHTARHKFNAGANFSFLHDKLRTDIRMNMVGKRKAPLSNTWIQTYLEGYAPAFTKLNASIIYEVTTSISVQLVINNLLDADYYGLGRETGSSFIEDYDFRDNINPYGHIPPYHPQAGRTFLLKLTLSLDTDE